jgi:transposase
MTDARDARHLARLLHLGEIVAVTIPSIEQEAARDSVRAREDSRGDLMSAVATAIPYGSSAHSSPNSA